MKSQFQRKVAIVTFKVTFQDMKSHLGDGRLQLQEIIVTFKVALSQKVANMKKKKKKCNGEI